MIEIKGKVGDLAKFTANGEIDNLTKDKKPNYSNIQKYALNGAIHYADAVTFYSDFSECLAIGINGYDLAGSTNIEYAVYFVSNPQIYQKLGDFSDLSFLKSKNLDEIIENCQLSSDEIEAKSKEIENAIIVATFAKDLKSLFKVWSIKLLRSARYKILFTPFLKSLFTI